MQQPRWVEALVLPPLGGANDVGQIGGPTNVAIKAGARESLVVATSAVCSVRVTYEGGNGQLTARAWLRAGTWLLRLGAAVMNVQLGVPIAQSAEVSIWVDKTPRDC